MGGESKARPRAASPRQDTVPDAPPRLAASTLCRVCSYIVCCYIVCCYIVCSYRRCHRYRFWLQTFVTHFGVDAARRGGAAVTKSCLGLGLSVCCGMLMWHAALLCRAHTCCRVELTHDIESSEMSELSLRVR